MPLWQIYHPEPAFSAADKRALALKVTALYQDFLPRFYVNVFFQTLPPGTAYLGGEPADDFVRVTIDHIARAMDNDAEQQQFLAACTRILQPYLAARGLRWELHVDETPFSLWTIEGLKPRRRERRRGEMAQREPAFGVGGVAALTECPMLKSDDERRFFIFA